MSERKNSEVPCQGRDSGEHEVRPCGSRRQLGPATWQDIDRPKPLYLDTAFVADGRPQAAIVAPDTPAYRAQADKIVVAVRCLSGAALPVYRDTDLDPWAPPALNLIALGNVIDNCLLGPLYACHYVAADRFYPGAGGHVLRTVHDPWGTGRNLVLVGGSEARGVAAAADRLVAALRRDQVGVSVPPLLQVTLGPEVLSRVPDLALEPDEALIEREMAEARNMLETSAHGGITEPLGRAGFLYYLTGKVGWAEVFRRLAYLMYEDFQSGREQYGGPWGMDADFRLHKMMPAWDLVEEAPIFTDQDRLEITRIYARFIVDCIPHAEAAVRDRKVRHNHTTFAALGLMYAGQYFTKYYGLREAEDWLYVADECFISQGQGWRPVEDSNGYQWITLYHMAKYALARPHMEYFEKGHLRQGAELALASMDSLGYQASYGDTRDPFGWGSEWPLLSMAAWYYGDGRYQWVAERPNAKAPRVIGLGPISAYNAGVEPVEPSDAIGVQVVPMDRRFFLSTGGPQVLPLERAFDKIALRGGLTEDSEYLLLDGISCGGHRHYDGNSIIRLTALGRIWLADCDYYCSTPNFHNGVLPLKDGVTGEIPPFTWSDLVADLGSCAFIRTTVRDYAGCDWERNIIWRKAGEHEVGPYGGGYGGAGVGEREVGPCGGGGGGAGAGEHEVRPYMVVADVMRAREEGDYDFRALWRVLGRVELQDSALTVAQQDRRLDIVNGDGATLAMKVDELTSSNWKPYTLAEPVVRVLQQDRGARLRAGEALTFLNLLRPRLAHEGAPEVRRLGPGSVLVRSEGSLEWTGVRVPDETTPTIATDAEAWWVGERRFAFAQGTRLECDGFSVRTDRPVSLELNLERGEAMTVADHAALLTLTLPGVTGVAVDGQERPVRQEGDRLTFTLPEGRHTLAFVLNGDTAVSDCLRRALGAMWQEAAVPRAGGRESSAREADPVWAVQAGAEVSALAPVETAEAVRLLAGDEEGGVRLLAADGRVLWRAQVEGNVTAVGSARFGSEGPALIVGSGRGLVTALDLAGATLWQYRIPYYKRDGIVRVLLHGDLNGDGREEVIVGAENWHYYALDHQGRFLWQFESVHASTAGAVADADGDGALELVAGTEYYWWSCVSAEGRRKWQHSTVYGPGASAVTTVADGTGARLVAFGCVDGTVQVVRPPLESGPDRRAEVAFVLRTGDRIAGLATRDGGGDRQELVVASANNSVYAVTVDGTIRWRTRLPEAPSYLWAGPDGVTVLADEGLLTVLDGDGQVLRTARLGGPAHVAALLEPEGLLVTSCPGSGLEAWRV
ncbi:MAG: PQQ-binding-like beta-propeller repeat protein [Anaerolineae bacterium]|nr:PQQ-binding-like beta-propeller repeat protein [Anaerolineae bacterium]